MVLQLIAFSIPGLLAYIDPGIVSLAIQSFCVLLFGLMSGFLFAPWRWVSSFFRRKDNPSDQ